MAADFIGIAARKTALDGSAVWQGQYDHCMTIEMAEARGAVMLRPWRVGVLVDTKSPAEVREAIANLSSVWGGRSMPIFDNDTPIAELENSEKCSESTRSMPTSPRAPWLSF